jgi:membrane protein DedA with SNARE-associated domain
MPETSFIWLPLNFLEWMPSAQAATLGLLTFVQEDVPTVGAAVLAGAGNLSWKAGFLGCFFGIWIGDALLYLLARGLGRPMLELSWARRFFEPAAVARSEQWFSKRGTWLLLSSRFVPGTRLPTYLAAGFLRLPFARFLAVTGLGVAIWTVGIFILAQRLGPVLVNTLRRWNAGGWAVLLAVAALLLIIRCARKLQRTNVRYRLSAALGRWTRWEFWPAWLFYAPVALNYLRLAIRYRSFTLPTAANPGIFSGGFVGESKILSLRDLHSTSPEFTAEAHLLAGNTPSERFNSFNAVRERARLEYPLILKPDVGQRGVGVKLVRTPGEARACLEHATAPMIVQRYAQGPEEVGVFYYRFPHERRGRIFAITQKIFPSVVGDGRSTIEDLIWKDSRARFMAAKYLRRFAARRAEVLPVAQSLRLVEAGNHAQGCIFKDGTHLWTEELERRIDAISKSLDGFFIGRYDIRYSSEEELRAGVDFQIIELNGAASEATSIYDARNSLLSAYRTLFRQWALVFAIADANRGRGSRPTELPLLWRKWRESVAYATTCPVTD